MLYSSDLVQKFGNPLEMTKKQLIVYQSANCILFYPSQEIKAAIPALPNRIFINILLVTDFELFLLEIIEKGLAHEIEAYDGCLNVRSSIESESVSFHAYALAFDFNRAKNPWRGRVSWSKGFLKVARKYFTCGADWTKKDGMHFQLKQL
jgi:hypothetical protein